MLTPNFMTLMIVIVVARFFGMTFRKLGQPSVMGEVLGGILLGPSVFGFLFPGLSKSIFHEEAMIFLRHIADLGITLYLFVMGLEINLPRLRRSATSALIISQFSILVPFILGILLAARIFDEYGPTGVSSVGFGIFIGISLSITAFPVLARILADSPLHKTPIGELALTCAAINDLTAWCLLALVTGLLGSSATGAASTIALTTVYTVFVLVVARLFIEKYLPRLEKGSERLPRSLLAFAVLGALISATLTDLIGIHAFFGAFLFGAAIPHDSLLARETTERLHDFVAILFLPAFFALTGLKTQLGLLAQLGDWQICAIVVTLAIVGKFSGTFLGARLAGLSNRQSSLLGVLMNTRGLVELIVLNLGLQTGIITSTLFSMLVVMALVTTFMTGPLLKFFYSGTSDQTFA